jgi:mandelate racemase
MHAGQLKIRSLEARAVAAPMKLPLQTASGAVSTAILVLIDLETSAGITGRAYLQSYTMASLKPIVALCEAMGEMVAGDPVAPFDIEKKLRAKFKLLGVHNMVLFAMAGIDMAAWDALAQSLEQPLVRLLGGTLRPVRAYNSKGLGIMPVKALP